MLGVGISIMLSQEFIQWHVYNSHAYTRTKVTVSGVDLEITTHSKGCGSDCLWTMHCTITDRGHYGWGFYADSVTEVLEHDHGLLTTTTNSLTENEDFICGFVTHVPFHRILPSHLDMMEQTNCLLTLVNVGGEGGGIYHDRLNGMQLLSTGAATVNMFNCDDYVDIDDYKPVVDWFTGLVHLAPFSRGTGGSTQLHERPLKTIGHYNLTLGKPNQKTNSSRVKQFAQPALDFHPVDGSSPEMEFDVLSGVSQSEPHLGVIDSREVDGTRRVNLFRVESK